MKHPPTVTRLYPGRRPVLVRVSPEPSVSPLFGLLVLSAFAIGAALFVWWVL